MTDYGFLTELAHLGSSGINWPATRAFDCVVIYKVWVCGSARRPAELWRRRYSAVQTDGGPRYAAVNPGAHGAMRPGVCEQVSEIGGHRGAPRTIGAKRAAGSGRY